ncbi:MAG: hypothetical protein ACYDIA_06140 [Candidatus Humimicrobiaceae bacterium]
MATNLNIEVSPLLRVRGHGDLVLNIKNKNRKITDGNYAKFRSPRNIIEEIKLSM